MKLVLHTPSGKNNLATNYQRAFAKAVELFIVTAYLTEWDKSLKLNSKCGGFRVIIGKDFGITRKSACEAIMGWLPSKRKSQFLVADLITGFHPKAVFWKESNGACYAIVGSSNLTRAAFESNYEANVFTRISHDEYSSAKRWVKEIEEQAVVVSPDWLSQYKEAARVSGGRGKASKMPGSFSPLIAFKLPRPAGMAGQILARRNHLAAYKKHRAGLNDLFNLCAIGKIQSATFYARLPDHWGYELGNRLQGAGWERAGKDSDFRALAKSYMRIIGSKQDDRDDVVAEEIDSLNEKQVGTRRAFLSEMLCLEFPKEFPVVNKPVQKYLKSVEFEAPRGASEGARYIDLAKKLRFSLLQNRNHPAKNLAELDAVIWLAYGRK